MSRDHIEHFETDAGKRGAVDVSQLTKGLQQELEAAGFVIVSKALFEAKLDEIGRLREALEVLLDEAECFNVSGVYFDEECMGHKGPALARQALDAVANARK